MVDVNVSSLEISTISGPSTLSVQVGVGPRGQRGSRIFVAELSPQLFFSPEVSEALNLEIYDLYINTNPSNEDYLYLYQFINSDGGNVWEQIVRLVPSQISISEVVDFSSGSGLIEIDLLNYYPQSLIDQLILGTPSVTVSPEASFAAAISVSSATIDGTDLSISLKGAKVDGTISALSESITVNANVNFVFSPIEIS
jgi:hypothetical protein